MATAIIIGSCVVLWCTLSIMRKRTEWLAGEDAKRRRERGRQSEQESELDDGG